MLCVASKQFQIFWSIIRWIAVDMMDDFAFSERTAQFLLHHDPMFQ
jgi:hypothetical protein